MFLCVRGGSEQSAGGRCGLGMHGRVGGGKKGWRGSVVRMGWACSCGTGHVEWQLKYGPHNRGTSRVAGAVQLL